MLLQQKCDLLLMGSPKDLHYTGVSIWLRKYSFTEGKYLHPKHLSIKNIDLLWRPTFQITCCKVAESVKKQLSSHNNLISYLGETFPDWWSKSSRCQSLTLAWLFLVSIVSNHFLFSDKISRRHNCRVKHALSLAICNRWKSGCFRGDSNLTLLIWI